MLAEKFANHQLVSKQFVPTTICYQALIYLSCQNITLVVNILLINKRLFFQLESVRTAKSKALKRVFKLLRE